MQVPGIQYVAHAEDGLAVHAVLLLKREFGAEFTIVRGGDPTVHCTERFLFTGRSVTPEVPLFPSRYLRRVVLPKDEVQRGLIVPPFARSAGELIALRDRPIASLGDEFTDALRHIHFLRHGRWLGDRAKRVRAKAAEAACVTF